MEKLSLSQRDSPVADIWSTNRRFGSAQDKKNISHQSGLLRAADALSKALKTT